MLPVDDLGTIGLAYCHLDLRFFLLWAAQLLPLQK
jgi:hypothetical protein